MTTPSATTDTRIDARAATAQKFPPRVALPGPARVAPVVEGRTTSPKGAGRARTLRVAVLTPGVGGHGGISRMMDILAAEFAETPELGVDVVQISTRSDGAHWTRPFVFLAAVARLSAACLLGRLDLVHVNLASHGSTWRKLVLAGIARATGTPYVIHLHGGEYREFWASRRGRSKAAIDGLFRHARRILVLGGTWRDLIGERLPEAAGRVVVVPNATRKPTAARAARAPDAPVCILFLGKLAPEKGVPQLLEALSALPSTPAWTAVLAGNGDVDGTRARVAALGLADRVEVPGWLGPDEVDRLWARGDIFVLPSFIENLPLSIMEAYAHGAAVVATPVGSVSEIVTDGETGLLIPPGDAAALARALTTLVGDGAQRERLVQSGRAAFETRFDLGVYARRMADLWREAAAPPR